MLFVNYLYIKRLVENKTEREKINPCSIKEKCGDHSRLSSLILLFQVT